jgi:hypothetical protein
MAVIKSGASSDNLTVDATSKAARVTMYDARGNLMGSKPTYRACTADTVAAAASATAPFAVIYGSASKTLRVQRIIVSGLTTTTLAIQGVSLIKYSSQPTGGTPVTLTQVPLDANDAAGTSNLCQVYTAAPTTGTALGRIASRRALNKSTTAVDGSPMTDLVFDFRGMDESMAITLRGTTQGVGLQLHVATATTCTVEIEWTEE